MTDSSLPPPPVAPIVLPLAKPSGGLKRLLGPAGEQRITFTPPEITIEHSGALSAPLRFAPGSVAVATVDPGPADVGKTARGRFPILHRLGPSQVIPRSEGIDGWLWTSTDGSAFTVIGDDAPNLAFIFSPPLASELLEAAFAPDMLAELAKRSPLGQPALFGLLLRVERPSDAETTLARFNLKGDVTDREVPPTQRRHLPDDKPANPVVGASDVSREQTSMPPPGMS